MQNTPDETQQETAAEDEWIPDESFYNPTPIADTPSKSGLSVIEKQYATLPKDIEKRVHILGLGSIGMLVAHSLRLLPDPPPVSLLFHKITSMRIWQKGTQQITVHRDGYDISQAGFDHEVVRTVNRQHGNAYQSEHSGDFMLHVSDEPITNLIVTAKAQQTVSALLSIKHRLDAQSSICILQNGLGIIDELNEQVFTDPATRPTYLQGVLTHGAHVPKEIAAHDPFYVNHIGLGSISLTILPRQQPPQTLTDIARSATDREKRDQFSMSARYLLRTLTRSPVLVAVGFPPTDLFLLQLEKLAVNCLINTLTVLLDARNGELLEHFPLRRTIRLMLAEISLVIRSLPELQGLVNVESRFSAQRLESVFTSVATTTAGNVSSTLADVRSGRSTEIKYMNGYIIKRGEELGIKAVVNYAMMQVVISKANMVQREARESVPVTSSVEK